MNDLIFETNTLSKQLGKQLAANEVSLQIKRNCMYTESLGLMAPEKMIFKMIIGFFI